MPRLLFAKTGRAVWISHLDLMRVFQRAFKRAGLPLTHTHGYNPRPSVSIALPLSVGVDSQCELLDFDLEQCALDGQEIMRRLNETLIEGVRVLSVYDQAQKIKNIAFLECRVVLSYDSPVSGDAVEKIRQLFASNPLLVQKKSKNGLQEQDIIPMIRQMQVLAGDDNSIVLQAVVCCQNPSLNPAMLVAAVEQHLPECKPAMSQCSRLEIFDHNMEVFR